MAGLSGDTIFAVSSGQPPAAIAVIRISGPAAMSAAAALAGWLPPSRQAGLRRLVDPASDTLLDHALVLVFPGPSTVTGEDLAELHLHGGRAVVAAVMRALGNLSGLRQAQPGEFTRRALMAGRIDLTEAEGLGDLLLAETEAQRRSALAASEGVVSRAVAGWSERLLTISARVEAALDFSDEDDVGDVMTDAIVADIVGLVADLRSVLELPPVERLRDGLRVVLAGPPNSGKSSLFNILCSRSAAIVSPIAGTTRDVIEAPIVRDGVAYLLVDTAGLVDWTTDPIERIGVDRAQTLVTQADILLWLADEPAPRSDALWLWPRADARSAAPPVDRIPVSAATGDGVPELWDALARRATNLLPRSDQLMLNARQRNLCWECHHALAKIDGVTDLLVIAELLRTARAALDRVTGRVQVEDMLDALFGRFCIGK